MYDGFKERAAKVRMKLYRTIFNDEAGDNGHFAIHNIQTGAGKHFAVPLHLHPEKYLRRHRPAGRSMSAPVAG
jgi:hypothetical protein